MFISLDKLESFLLTNTASLKKNLPLNIGLCGPLKTQILLQEKATSTGTTDKSVLDSISDAAFIQIFQTQ